MHIDLTGKVALITGAAQGIGAGTAKVMSAAGAHVVVNDIQAEKGEQIVRELRQKGFSAEFIETNISNEQDVAKMIETIRANHNALHILVNNAGFAMFKGITDTEPNDWDNVMSVDLRGIYLVTRASLPLLEAGAPASVINIASVHAQLTVANMTAYATAKGAVVTMVRSLAQELGPRGIRVNAISPGFVDTPLFRSWLDSEPDPEESLKRVTGILPIGHIASQEDIGNLVTFLSSDKAVSITGANYVIDSGLTTRLMH
ncbi:MAG: SDR family NAD(P)-dependent oxidoreductase [Xenococcaceae cyanobacterium]